MKGPSLEREREGECVCVCVWMTIEKRRSDKNETDYIEAKVQYHCKNSLASSWAGPAL